MKIQLPTKLLKEALSRVAHIPGINGVSIHTQAVKLTADLAGFTLMRFTSEAKITLTLEEDVVIMGDDEDEPSVNHSALMKLVDACPGKLVDVTTDDKYLRLQSGNAKWKLKIFEEHIVIDPPENDAVQRESVNLLLEDLVEQLSFVAHAASKDEAGQPALCGVHIQDDKHGLLFIATDAKRCHVGLGAHHLKANCTIPNEGVESILKAIGSTKGPAELTVSDSFVSLVSASLEISVGLLSDPFPSSPVKFIHEFETSIKSKLRICRDEFVEALETCSRINDSSSPMVSLKVSKTQVQVYGSNTKEMSGTVEIDCESTADLEASVHASNFGLCLRRMPTDEKGGLELLNTGTAMFIKTPARIAFFALAAPKR